MSSPAASGSATDGWIRVTTRRQVPPREGRVATISNREVAIFNLGDRFLAVDNRCPHKGGPLCDGIVSGGAVVCPLHAWKVDLQTGVVERPASTNACIQAYPTRLEGDVVLVRMPVQSAAGRSVGANPEGHAA
jgi:nitrite reductase (NADH) small subunit